MGDQDPVLRDLMAEIAYAQVYFSSGPYFALRLNKDIDNGIVARKTKQLQELEDGYQKVMAFKSPQWVIKACFRANEINREFADFLVNAPVPHELTEDQGNQYRALIRQKAQAYTDKADKYIETCVQLARKWEICDPQLAGYFIPAANPQGQEGHFMSLSGNSSTAQIAGQGLQDETFVALYQALLRNPDDRELQLKLANAYLNARDYQQASLIAKNTLSNLGSERSQLKANLFQILGISHLNCGHDALAKEAFTQALEVNSTMVEARTKLADIYRHYGHQQKASELDSVSPSAIAPSDIKRSLPIGANNDFPPGQP